MRRNLRRAQLAMLLLVALFAFVHAAYAACANVQPASSHCLAQHVDECAGYSAPVPVSTPDAKAAWPRVQAGFASADRSPGFLAADVRASRLSRVVPEARNLSIVLLNLRQ